MNDRSNRRPPANMLDGMADIVRDLWQEQPRPTPTDAPADPEQARVYSVRSATLPFDALWKVADDPIDWTEALASETPTDRLTDPKKWRTYHQQAERVLRGDTGAYLEVLKAANPMADLTPYVSSLDVATQDADTLRAAFTVRSELLNSDGRHYLAGMALRIARDLMAVLPVSAVVVEARRGEETLLSVSFERNELYKVRFAFIQPEAFVEKCGGTFAPQA